MIHDICRHTNSYANEHIIACSHSSYTKADVSWKDATPEEINRLIALLTGDKLHKVDSFVNYFKSRCDDLYQPRQNLAIDERMVKSRHRSRIR